MLQFREKLELSYRNTCALLQHVDSLPERAEWQECMITFKDHPKEQHVLQFRDIIQAIHALLGNIRHTGKIVYQPRKIFRDVSHMQHIYNKMWSGEWWHAVQASTFTIMSVLSY